MASQTWTTPSDWDRANKKAAGEHSRSQEAAYWWGKPSETLAGTHPRRTTGGFFNYVTTNQVDAGGQLTEAEFFGGLRPMFRFGDKKVGFAAPLPVDVLNGFPRSKLQTEQGEKTFGLRVMNYISPHGDLLLMTHKAFEGSKYGGVIAIVDPDHVSKRYMKGRDTHVNENIQENDRDGRKDELLTESGFELHLDKRHGYFYGITS
jgi:hypothetical protein